MQSLTKENVQRKADNDDADDDDNWFDLDPDQLVDSLRTKMLSSAEKVVPVIDQQQRFEFNSPTGMNSLRSGDVDGGNYLPAGYAPPATDGYLHFPARRLKSLLNQQPLGILLELIDPEFARHLSRSKIEFEVARLTMRCLAMVCQAEEELAMPQHLHDLLQVVNGSFRFWKTIISKISSNREFKEDVRSVFVAIQNTIQRDMDADLLSNLEAALDELPPRIEASGHPAILPSLLDFDVKPQVEPNRLKGNYTTIKEYVNVQMALVRNDFLLNIQEGIAAVRGGNHTNVFRQHQGVRIETAKLRDESVTVIRVQDDDGQPLMVGSLLLFTSTDAVEDLAVALVLPTDPELGQVGFTQIELQDLSKDCSYFHEPVLLLEPTLFFEPYHQTYQALSQLLRRKTFSAIQKTIALSGQEHKQPPTTTGQLQAICSGCAEQLTLIQGAPGTGKSYVGLAIVRKLIISPTPSATRILIVCATNQALDHFLAGVAKFAPNKQDIVRLGGQSKDPDLDRFNIRRLHQPQNPRLVLCLRKTRQSMIETAPSPTLRKRLSELQQVTDALTILSAGCRVIGMTSTMAARCQTLLALLGAGTVLVEEAAAMLEPHLMVALTKDVMRVVLIGDHKQLRPTTGSPISAQRLHFDVSLFERLFDQGLTCCVPLTVQRRLHPRIADLVRATRFYERYDDDESDPVRDEVVVDGRNVFFYDHQHPENMVGPSRANIGEAQQVRAACDRLLAAGCPKTDIVILTPYTGQAKQLAGQKSAIAQLSYRGVPISVLDNYQGREQRVVLLSLVRSTKATEKDVVVDDDGIGFLAVDNRVCVALSRARAALFMFGNVRTLARRSGAWERVERHLRGSGAIGGWK